MKAKYVSCLIAVFALFSTAAMAQTTWTVDQGGGGDFTTIQDCIDAAIAGDTCQVNPGTYYENIDFIGKDLTVVKATKVAPTIDGSLLAPVVTFENFETEDAVLDGFLLQHGLGSNYGGGIYCENSSPAIMNCTIRDNGAVIGGGGIYSVDGSLEITGCTIMDNMTSYAFGSYGGGIYFSGDSLVLSNCTITGNQVMGSMPAAAYGGGIAFYGNDLWVENCDIRENAAFGEGGGILCESGSVKLINCNLTKNSAAGPMGSGWGGGMVATDVSLFITNCTFSENTALYGGGGIYCSSCSLDITNSILWGDVAGVDPEIHLSGASSAAVTYTDLEGGWPGTGNINVNPLFVDPANNDFHLQTGSPCIDAGNNSAPDLPMTDIDGEVRKMDGDGDGSSVVDMGADEVPSPPWGSSSIVAVDRDVCISNTVNKLGMMVLPLAGLLLWRVFRRKDSRGRDSRDP